MHVVCTVYIIVESVLSEWVNFLNFLSSTVVVCLPTCKLSLSWGFFGSGLVGAGVSGSARYPSSFSSSSNSDDPQLPSEQSSESHDCRLRKLAGHSYSGSLVLGSDKVDSYGLLK